MFFYKPYDVNEPRPKTLELTFIQNKIDNLEKYIKYMQVPLKTMPFYPPPYYKSLQSQGKQNK